MLYLFLESVGQKLVQLGVRIVTGPTSRPRVQTSQVQSSAEADTIPARDDLELLAEVREVKLAVEENRDEDGDLWRSSLRSSWSR